MKSLTRSRTGLAAYSSLDDLAPLLTGDLYEAEGAARAIARSLSRVHKSNNSLDGAGGVLDYFFELSEQASSVAVKHPDQTEKLVDMLEIMGEILSGPRDLEGNFGEGQIEPINFPVGDGTIVSTDVVKPMESAQMMELAGLIQTLRMQLRDFPDENRADHLTHCLLDEYSAETSLTTSSFQFHLGLQTYLSMCQQLMVSSKGTEEFDRTISYYPREFERAISLEPGATPRRGVETGAGGSNHRHEIVQKSANQIATKAQETTTPEFIRRVVHPHVFNEPMSESSPDCQASTIHQIGTGRATVKYVFGGKTVVFGKLFSDRNQALHSFQVQRELWDRGFDRGLYRVAEPLAYIPQHKLVLMANAEGRELETLFDEQDRELATYARQAARWLVKLHTIPVRVGRTETLWRSMWLIKLVRRLAKASQLAPQHRKALVEMVAHLCELGERGLKEVPFVQAHGTFHYQHVLVNGAATSVIDFDRSFPSDPAKDLAEFLSFMRWKTFERTGSTQLAEEPTKEFLEEYLHQLPENSANLRVHWGAYTLLVVLKQVKKYHTRNVPDTKMRFAMDEFQSAISGRLLPGSGGEAS